MGRQFLIKRHKDGCTCYCLPKGVRSTQLRGLRKTTPQLKGTRLVRAKNDRKAIQKFMNKKIRFKVK